MHDSTGMRSSNLPHDNRKSKIQNLKWAGFLATFVLLVGVVGTAEAQQKKAPRIGYLSALSPSATARVEAFRQGLRELGYVEGKNYDSHRYDAG